MRRAITDATNKVETAVEVDELDEREDEAGGTGIGAFARAAGIGFREALDYARGRKFIAGNAKCSHLSLEKAQAVARALGYKLQLVRDDIVDEQAADQAISESADANLRRRLSEEIEARRNPFRNTNDIEDATGIKFRPLMEYARGVRVVNGTERRSAITVEQAEKLATFFGVRLSVSG